jgi:hypothetical protein
MDPTQPPASFLVAVEQLQQEEQKEEEQRQLLRQKYDYMLCCAKRFACNYSIDFSVITYLDAMLLFQEVLSQMSNYYGGFDKQIEMLNEIEKLKQSADESAQDGIALLQQKLVSNKKMRRIIMYNKEYMIHYFTQQWIQRYPETDKTKLQNDLELSYKARDIMYGLSPKGDHTERVEEMEEFEMDSKQEWFVSYEQFQKDSEKFPEFAIYRGMNYH